MSLENIPENMTAVQVVSYSAPHELRTVPTPRALQPHDLLVKVAVASLCHTDFMVASGVFNTALPCTASHEGSGTIAGLGSAVTAFAAGDRVMCGLYRDFCGACADCLGPENFRQYCQHSKGAIGVNVDGAFAEYVVVDSRSAARLPDAVSFETAAPLACAGCTVWRSILQADLVKGEWIALVGSGGGLGHLGVQFAKALGLNVVGVDARDEALELTKEAGADVVVDARKGKEHVVAEVQRVTAGKGADATVTISDAEGAAALACAVTKMHGVMVQVAQPENVSIPFQELIFRDIRVRGSLICSPEEAKRMLDVVAEHKITVKTNAFHGLKEIKKLIELAEGGHMKGKGIIIVDQKQIDKERKVDVELV